MFVNYYYYYFLISVCFSVSVGKIPNGEFASKNETDYVMNAHPGLEGDASAPAVNITEQPKLPCKEKTVAPGNSTPWYLLDDVSLHHYGTLRRNSTGHRTNLVLHFAVQVQTDGAMIIWLTEKEDSLSGIRYALVVGWDNNQRTYLWYNDTEALDIDTPDILSFTQFRSYYIKIDDGILQFGKDGDSPLMSYSDLGLGLLNYYRFDMYGGPSKFHFCPAAIEGSP